MERSRRWVVLAALPAVSLVRLFAQKPKNPSPIFRYSDPATEFPVLRLTDPNAISLLPAHFNRAVARKGGFLVYGSDAEGSMAVHRLDLKTGASRVLAEAAGVDPKSITLTADERSVCCVAGGRLLSINLGNSRVREVYKVPEGFEARGGMSVAEDGLYAALIEKQADGKPPRSRLRLVRMADGMATTLAEASEEMSDPIPRPRRASVLYRRGGGLWIANYDAQQNYKLKLAEGELGTANWAPDGRSILYLNYPADAHRLHNIREIVPDTKEDKAVADTTQYVGFERNADATVFVGASGSKASPYLFLLVRAVKRELTLCEHRASDPAMVAPVFAPNSQSIFFGSDRHGKPAIYSMAVEKLVSETDSSQ
jgi:oligogalacturonide lyase